ncbi:MAG: hypothetical protein WCL18_06195 [bacterium]
MEVAKHTRKNVIKKIGDDISTAQLFSKEKSFIAIESKLITDEGKKFRNEIRDAIGDDINTPKLIATINSYLIDMNQEVRSILYRLEIHFLKI